MDSFLRIALRPAIVHTALKVSGVVGTILNVINQWQALFGDAPVSWVHVVMNYVVPYCVSTYSATRAAQRAARG
jgi:hypothetical protein